MFLFLCFLAIIFMQEWTSPVYVSQNHLLDVHLCHNDLNRWCINKGLTTNPSICCFHLVISSFSTRNQLSRHRATFLTISKLQMVVLIWRGERGGPETNGNIWTSGSDTPSHLARFHPLRSRSRAQALLRSCKPSSHKPSLNHPVTQTARESAFSPRHWLHVASVTRHWHDNVCGKCLWGL